MSDIFDKIISTIGDVETKYDNARIGEYGTMFIRHMWRKNKKDMLAAALGAAVGVGIRKVVQWCKSHTNYNT